jgi:hypothetical protein
MEMHQMCVEMIAGDVNKHLLLFMIMPNQAL